MADYQEEITEIRTKLRNGVRRTSVDGLSAEFDLEQLRKQLAWYIANDDLEQARGNARPAAATIRLDFF
jgi:hypothetical protein